MAPPFELLEVYKIETFTHDVLFSDGLLKSTKKIVETKRRDVYNDTEIFSSSSEEESDDFRNPMFPSL